MNVKLTLMQHIQPQGIVRDTRMTNKKSITKKKELIKNSD
jgi:hypothetical protein